MNRSLGETEALARKATRGAGHVWGIADEAGRAIRWLEAHGLPGVATLAAHLDRVTEPVEAAGRAVGPGLDGDAHSTGKRVQLASCPFATGARLCDSVTDWATDGGCTVDEVGSPLLLLPSIASAAALAGAVLRLHGVPGEALVDGTSVRLTRAHGWVAASAATLHVERAPTTALSGRTRARLSRAAPTVDDWSRLERFAALTYAPATAASRERGAG